MQSSCLQYASMIIKHFIIQLMEKALPSYTVNYTHAHAHAHTHAHAHAHTHTQWVRICCHNTDLVHANGHDRINLGFFSQALYKADGSSVIRNMLEHF